ncbi:MAG: hypothetical protein ABEJ02_01925 [Candidatus Paceibacteria bacterium]
MLRKKQRTFLIIALAVLLVLILGLVYYFYFYSQPSSVNKQKGTQETTTTQKEQSDRQIREASTETGTPEQETQERQIEETTPETTAKQTARIFVERFASRSSQNENEHLESIYPMVTEEMRSWVEKQTVEQTREYSGQTTEVIASNIEEMQEEQATVIVQVQQTKTEENKEETLQKEGRVELLKENGSWKVDGLYWQ